VSSLQGQPGSHGPSPRPGTKVGPFAGVFRAGQPTQRDPSLRPSSEVSTSGDPRGARPDSPPPPPPPRLANLDARAAAPRPQAREIGAALGLPPLSGQDSTAEHLVGRAWGPGLCREQPSARASTRVPSQVRVSPLGRPGPGPASMSTLGVSAGSDASGFTPGAGRPRADLLLPPGVRLCGCHPPRPTSINDPTARPLAKPTAPRTEFGVLVQRA